MYVGVLQIPIDDPNEFRDDLADLVRAHARINQRRLTRYKIPHLYESRVRWRRAFPYVAGKCDGNVCEKPEQADRWQDVVAVHDSGEGDCKDLVAVRLAELWLEGDLKADVEVILFPEALGEDYDLYHVVLRRGDGEVEDPSRVLGMDEVA